MPAIRNCQVSVLNIDKQSLTYLRKKDPNDNYRRRQIWGFTDFNTCCSCVLQILAGISLMFLLILAVLLPYFITSRSLNTDNPSASIITYTTLTTTSITTQSTTSSTATSTSSTATSTITTTTTTDTTTTTSCYFAGDYASLVEGGYRQISQLKTGDRVWSLTQDGTHLIQDQIMAITHAASNTPTYFYTFTTFEGYRISLTDAHYVVIIDHQKKMMMKTVRASQVTLDNQLVTINRSLAIKTIDYSVRVGFYSPITLSGYLLVNNLSTSVYSEILNASHDFLHEIAIVGRIYYHVTRWIFGTKYVPFETSEKEGEIHPMSMFIMNHYEIIRFCFLYFRFIIFVIGVVGIMYFCPSIVSYGIEYFYHQLKMI